MKKYEVTVQETLVRKIIVEAESPEAAENSVRQDYDRSELILDADDFAEVQFSTKKVPTRDRAEGR